LAAEACEYGHIGFVHLKFHRHSAVSEGIVGKSAGIAPKAISESDDVAIGLLLGIMGSMRERIEDPASVTIFS
jgi:hypothetical protein